MLQRELGLQVLGLVFLGVTGPQGQVRYLLLAVLVHAPEIRLVVKRCSDGLPHLVILLDLETVPGYEREYTLISSLGLGGHLK